MKVFTIESVMKIKQEAEKCGLKMWGDNKKILNSIQIIDKNEIITLYKEIDMDGLYEKPIRISWASIGSVEKETYNKFLDDLNKMVKLSEFIDKNIILIEYDANSEEVENGK